MNIKYLKIDLINPFKSHKKVEMNKKNNQHHHKTNLDNGVHPFKATSLGPLQWESIFLKEKWKILIQSQMVITATEWILLGCSTRLHDPIASFISEFGEKLALLALIEDLVLFDNLHKRTPVCISFTKIHIEQLVRFKIYIGEVEGSNPGFFLQCHYKL